MAMFRSRSFFLKGEAVAQIRGDVGHQARFRGPAHRRSTDAVFESGMSCVGRVNGFGRWICNE